MKDKFPEAWANLEITVNILKVVTGALLLICLILALSLAGSLKKSPILVKYDTNKVTAENASYLIIDNNWISSFVSKYMEGYGNWRTDEYDSVVKSLENIMTAQMKIDLIKEFEKGVGIVKENKVSNKFSITKIDIKNDKSPYIVMVYGKNMMTSGEMANPSDAVYKMIIKKQNPTFLDPWGLVVSGLGEVRADEVASTK